MTPALVSLVGGGPGDPELLTIKAVQRLAAADLVLYDALLGDGVLAYAPRAQCFYVGKRHGAAAISQDAINRLLVSNATRGRRVVRLKCGDPFVFGRGGEEALALARAGVPFEIVPGVSSALAAPALANVPVTHRGLAAAFVVVSGHSEDAYAPTLRGLEPLSATLVILMGLHNRVSIARWLIARHWPATTPVAACFSASHASSESWFGTLGALIDLALPAGDAPATLVIGRVVSLAVELSTALAPVAMREHHG